VFSRISGRKNSGGASFHAPPLLAARGPTRSRKKFQAAGASGAASSPLPFPRRRRQHRYLQNNQNATQAVDFSFHFLCFFQIFFGFFPFFKSVPFLCLLCRSVIFFFFRWQIRRGGPSVVGEEAASLLWERDVAARLAEFAAGDRSAG
jgi:hypothetical protein